MKCLVCDHEGAISSHAARIWADLNEVELKLKPTGGIGAGMVERHHELLRQSFHRIHDQALQEGITFQDSDVVAKAVMVKNCLLNVHGQTPFKAHHWLDSQSYSRFREDWCY